MKVAVVDLGTNTCRLYLAGVSPEGAIEPDTRLTTVVRLGQGVDSTGRLHPDAVARTMECLRGYAPRLEAYGPARRLLIATSVLRDAGDGGDFLERVRREIGLPWRILSGDEEARLSFSGGTGWLAGGAEGTPGGAGQAAAAGRTPVPPAPPDPLLLVDIGGGSTEFAAGAAGADPRFVRSLDIGVVRLTERFVHHDPPVRDELEALAGHVAAAIREEVPAELNAAVGGAVGVAGTFTTLVAYKLVMRRYDPRVVQGHVLTLDDLERAITRFEHMTSAERGRLPGIQPGREDVILAGAIIARETCAAFGLDRVTVSDADLLEGAALALAAGSLHS